MGQIVARSSVSILDGGVDALNRETDLTLAEAAIPANLKLIEGLISEDPDNPELLAYAAQGFYSYAFGFVELENRERADRFYRRGFHYGWRALERLGLKADADKTPVTELAGRVRKLGKGAVPALFWTASCWAKHIDLNRDNPVSIAGLAATEALMARVRELNPDYYYGGVHIYYGVYYGARAPMFGGDFARSERFFEVARSATEGRLLMVDVLQAEFLERQRFDRDAFHRLLTGVTGAPSGLLPEMALANAVAKQRAAYLLHREDEWF
jgi:hypothetical protein